MLNEAQLAHLNETSRPVNGHAVAVAAEPTQTGESPLRGLPLAQLWANRWLIIGVALAVAILGNLYVWTRMPPQYRATATVRVLPVVPRLLFRTDDNGMIPLYQSFVNTQVTIMESPDVLGRALEREDVQKTRWYQKNSPNVEQFEEIVTVVQERKSELLKIAATVDNPDDAATLANAVVHEYLATVNQASRNDDQAVFSELVRERETRVERIRELEDAVAAPRRALGTTDPDPLLADRSKMLDAMRNELDEVRRQVATFEWRVRRFDERMRPGDAPAVEQLPTAVLESDHEWLVRKRELQVIHAQIEFESQRLGDEHPTLKELRMRTVLFERLLREREQELATVNRIHAHLSTDTQTPAASIEQMREQLAFLRHREGLLAADLQKLQGEYNNMLSLAEELRSRQSELDRERRMYEVVRDRLSQEEVESRSLGSIRLAGSAVPPSSAYGDRRKLLALVACLAGLGLGVGAAYVRGCLAQRLNMTDDLRHGLGTPATAAALPGGGRMPLLLGEVPLIRNARPLVIPSSPILSEAIRIVRTALLDALDRERANVVQVTSAGSGVGKTELAILLSKSLARCGKRVLLVDADLRSHSVAGRMGLDAGEGLAGQLARGLSDHETIYNDVTPGLSVLTAGEQSSGADSELLANGRLEECIARWKSTYDLVVIDTPPVLPVADARIIARCVDRTIFVVRDGHCSRGDVVDSLHAIELAGGRVMGIVLISASWRQRYYDYGSGLPRTVHDDASAVGAGRGASSSA